MVIFWRQNIRPTSRQGFWLLHEVQQQTLLQKNVYFFSMIKIIRSYFFISKSGNLLLLTSDRFTYFLKNDPFSLQGQSDEPDQNQRPFTVLILFGREMSLNTCFREKCTFANHSHFSFAKSKGRESGGDRPCLFIAIYYGSIKFPGLF